MSAAFWLGFNIPDQTSDERPAPGAPSNRRRFVNPASWSSRRVGHRVKLALGSCINYVDLVHEMAEDLARGSHFPKAAALDIALAVREAYINAVKHGNDNDQTKKVEVVFEANASRFMVRVRDEGDGFDWDRPADPLAEENISRPSGRGIFFMKHFVDRVVYHKLPGKGTEVLLEKHLQPAADDGEAMKRRKE